MSALCLAVAGACHGQDAKLARDEDDPRPTGQHVPTLPAAAQAPSQPLAVDADGDPLPPGAVARLGTSWLRPGGPVRFVAGGKALLVASTFGNTIYLRDGFTGKALRRFEVRGHPQILDFAPDGKTVALIDRSGGAKAVPGILLRDLVSGKQVAHLPTGLGETLLRAVFAPSGSKIATATTDAMVVVWDASSGKKLHVLPMEGPVVSMAFGRAGKTLDTACFQQGLVVQRWDAATGKKLVTLPRFAKEFFGVIFSPDGQLLALMGHRGAANHLAVTDARGKELYRIPVRFGFYAFSPGGDLLAVSGVNDTQILDARTGKPRARLEGFVHNLVFSPDGKRIASNAAANLFGLWDVTGRNLHPVHVEEGHGGPITDLAISPDGRTLFASGLRLISMWDLRGRRLTHRLHNGANVTPKWNFLTDGRLLASSTPNGPLTLWDPATGRERDRLDGQPGPVVGLDLSPDGKTLAVAAATKAGGLVWEVHVRLWDVAGKKEVLPRPPLALRPFPLLQLPPVSEAIPVAYSPDGKLLAVGEHARVLLWEVGSDKKPRTIDGAWTKPPPAPLFP
jgi:WD40 repeat protein